MAARVIYLRPRIAPASLVRATRARLGLSPAAFAAALSQHLDFTAMPGMVKSWVDGTRQADGVAEACEVIASRAEAEPELPADEVTAAALEAAEEQSCLLAEPGPLSIGSLWEQSIEIARAANRSPRETFGACRRIRARALQLAGQAHRPRALTDLYVITGQATALMASAAFDLNRWDASSTLAQSAVSYADLVGHASLQAWTLGLSALLANWRNEPDIALAHFRRGLEIAPVGTPRARMRYIAARSYALLGDTSSVSDVLQLARRDQDDAEQHTDSLCEETGGEFAFGRARADACAAAAWLDLGHGREAKAAARRALSDLTALPAARQSVSQVTGARIDLATACLLGRERDEAVETLGHVFAVPSPLRNVSLSGRLARARQTLVSPQWADDHGARKLDEALGEWLAGRSQAGS
jgi:hypothetical protein